MRVLILYYSYTRQTHRVAGAMAESFRDRGCEAEIGEIRFTDPRFEFNFPLQPFWRKMLGMIPAQILGRTGEYEIDPRVFEQPYDLVCIGSPTWWFFPAMPVSSFLKSEAAERLLDGRRFAVFAVCRALWRLNLRTLRRLAVKAGGEFVDGTRFVFRGGQVRSMLSLINYLQHGEDRRRFVGWKIHPFGISTDELEHARSFADGLVEKMETIAVQRASI